MNKADSFLNAISSFVSTEHKCKPPLLNCLQRVFKEFNSNIDLELLEDLEGISIDNFNDYERSIGLLLFPITVSPQNIEKPFFPILLQDCHENIFLFLKRKNNLNVLYDCQESKILSRNASSINFKKSWQFFPVKTEVAASFSYLIKFIFTHFKLAFLLSVIAGIGLSASGLVIVAIINYIFGHVYESGQYFQTTLFLSFGCILTGIGLFSYLNDLFIKYLNAKCQIYILPKVFQSIINLDVKTLNQYTSGDIVQRLSIYESSIAALFPLSLQGFFCIFSLLFLLSYMAYCNLMLATAYFIICFLWLGIKMIFIPANIKYMNDQFTEQGRLSSFLNETLAQIHKIRSAHKENNIFNKWLLYLINIKYYAANSLRIEMWLLLLDAAIHFALLSSIYFIYYFASPRNNYLLLQFMVCSGQFLERFDKLSGFLWAVINFIPSLQRIKPLLTVATEPALPKKKYFKLTGDIELKDICVRDIESGRLLLDHVSLQIKPGQFVGFIGTSGAGKSTLFKLLLGLEMASSGIIMFDNENSNHLDQQFLRKQFGAVLQTSALFPGTIYSNIATNKNITLDAAWDLAKCVGIDKEIQLMPMKMHTYVGEGSDSLSGGQKQKILIARALATQPKVLLLDEATSALDATSQAVIYQHLHSLKVTRLVIAHRFSTIEHADVIYRLEQGKLYLNTIKSPC